MRRLLSAGSAGSALCVACVALAAALLPGGVALAAAPTHGTVREAVGTQAAASVSIGIRPAAVTFGAKSEVSGRLRRTADQAPLAKEKITLYQRRAGTTRWVGWASATTAADGTVRFTVSFGRNTQFRLGHAVSALYAAATSKPVDLRVDPIVSIAAPSIAKTFNAVTVTGQIAPTAGRRTVYLQRYTTSWKTVLTAKTGNSGKYTFTLNPTSTVVYKLRTYLPKASTHRAVLSAKTTVTVADRDLVQGLRGADVLLVQQRLAALHYDTGAVNGTYSFDTFHAVTAFEKVQGLPRDGVVTARVLAALAKPVLPTVRYGSPGLEIEVDKTHQVVMLVDGGTVSRILDASTGFGGSYTYAGVTYQALTPEGSFTIERKINALRTSHLGTL